VIVVGDTRAIPLIPKSVAAFYAEYLEALRSLGVGVRLYGIPVEVETAIPFAEDQQHSAYDRDAAERCWRTFVQKRCSSSFRARTWLRPTSVAGTALPWSESQMRRMRERFTDTTRSAQPSYQPGGSLAGKLSSDVSPTGSRRRGATILDYAPPSVMNRSAP